MNPSPGNSTPPWRHEQELNPPQDPDLFLSSRGERLKGLQTPGFKYYYQHEVLKVLQVAP